MMHSRDCFVRRASTTVAKRQDCKQPGNRETQILKRQMPSLHCVIPSKVLRKLFGCLQFPLRELTFRTSQSSKRPANAQADNSTAGRRC